MFNLLAQGQELGISDVGLWQSLMVLTKALHSCLCRFSFFDSQDHLTWFYFKEIPRQIGVLDDSLNISNVISQEGFPHQPNER